MQTHDEEALLTADEAELEEEAAEAPAAEAAAGFTVGRVSGLYARVAIGLPFSLEPAPNGIFPIRREEIRLDVDGRYPQMTVSGTIRGFLVSRIHWIARLRRTDAERSGTRTARPRRSRTPPSTSSHWAVRFRARAR